MSGLQRDADGLVERKGEALGTGRQFVGAVHLVAATIKTIADAVGSGIEQPCVAHWMLFNLGTHPRPGRPAPAAFPSKGD